MRAADLVADWAGRGEIQRVGDDEVFVVDGGDRLGGGPPLLVLHGYPTSTIDYAAVLPALGAGRRVVLFDFPGFGCSAKPDRAYSLFGQADVAEAVVTALGIDEVDLLTHDMGDSIGAELLARDLDGTLGFEVRHRVLTNGSIYLGLAQLTDGQQFLAALPDEAIAEADAPDVDALTQALTGTLAPAGGDESKPDPEHVRAAALLIVQSGGNRLLARQIRYIEERRQHEARLGARDRDAPRAADGRLGRRGPDRGLGDDRPAPRAPTGRDPRSARARGALSNGGSAPGLRDGCPLRPVSTTMAEAARDDGLDLRSRALAVLEDNHRDGYTVPAEGLYPYQWCWDSGPIALGWAAAGRWDRVGRARTAHVGAVAVGHGAPHRLLAAVRRLLPRTGCVGDGPGAADDRADPTTTARERGRAALRRRPGPRAGNSTIGLCGRGSSPGWRGSIEPARGPHLAAVVVHPWESGMDNSPAWDEPLVAMPEATHRHLERRDVASVLASQRPTNKEYRHYLGIVTQLRKPRAGTRSARSPTARSPSRTLASPPSRDAPRSTSPQIAEPRP